MNFDPATFSFLKENDQAQAAEELLSPSKNAEYKNRLAEGLQLAENSSRILAFKKKVKLACCQSSNLDLQVQCTAGADGHGNSIALPNLLIPLWKLGGQRHTFSAGVSQHSAVQA